MKLKHLFLIPCKDLSGVKITASSDEKIKCVEYKISDDEGKIAASGKENASEFIAAINSPHLWKIEDPYLYSASVKVTFEDGSEEEMSDTFGMRSLSVSGADILLNGKPFYMRAYIRGHKCHEHGNLLDLSEREFYEKGIKIAKEYGYNTIRFHSLVPPKGCFEAADKLGMFIHIEMRAEKEEYDNLSEMVTGLNSFVTEKEVEEYTISLMNHPSFMVYCIGNEIKHPGSNPRIRELAELIKKYDPSRLFIDTCAHGEFDRDYVEFDVQHMSYYYPFGSHHDMFENTDNLLVFGSCTGLETVTENGSAKITRAIVPERPIIAHEVCHYTALRDYETLSKKFKAANKPEPWWIEEEKKMIAAKGLNERYPEMFRASKAFQLMSWKLALEGIRRSPILRGFHMLQFADTDVYENSNGVVDCFDEKSGVDEKRFLRFNGDTVLLADIPTRWYFEGDTAVVPISVSNYSQQDYGKCELQFEVTDVDSGENILSGVMHDIYIDARGQINLAKLHLTFPATEKSRSLRLTCRLVSELVSEPVENDWDLWCFTNKPEKFDVSGCAFNLKTINAQSRYHAVGACPSKGENVYVTDVLDDTVFEELSRGANVVLFYRAPITRHVRDKSAKADKYNFRATWDRFKAVIWDRGTNYGGLINKPEALSGFPTNGISDLRFARLIDDSDKIILDTFPEDITPIFEEIDKSSRDRFDADRHLFALSELQYDRTLRKFGHIFEINVGKGKLLVTGLNFLGLGTQMPEVCAMFEALINYAKSANFKPEKSMDINTLRDYLKKSAEAGPVRERMMTQFWQLDDTPVESLQYWTDSQKYNEEGDALVAEGKIKYTTI